MISKTPNFDKALDEYFSKLELDEKGGQWRTCRFSGKKFYVRPEDIGFYKKIRVPLPTLSPRERVRLILSFWNSYYLYNTKSALTGKQIISQYPPGSPYKVYEHQVWFSDVWNPSEYARNYDFSKSFFSQLKNLSLDVPRPNLIVGATSVNSDYTNDSINLKNCYLVFNSLDSENCHYTLSALRSRDCVDCFDVFDSTQCYECFESHELYNCSYVDYSKNCLDSYFLYDCRNCTNCFGGVNLRHKKYIFFGERLTKEAYEKKIASINLGDRNVLKEYLKKFEEMTNKAIHKPHHNEKAINCFGDYNMSSRECYSCLFAEKTEKSAYIIGSVDVRDSQDITGVGSELSYMTSGAFNSYKALFSANLEGCRETEYSILCGNSHDVFGCVGLLNKSFCIFNKQYTEEEYWEVVDKIKTKMMQDGEYGEFLPPDFSPFPYNISVSGSYKGYEDFENAKKYGYKFEDIHTKTDTIVENVIDAEEVPADIKDVSDDILNKIIFDKKNNKKFRYTKIELDLHRKFNMPLPLEHFTARLDRKRAKFGSILIQFFRRTCSKCGISFEAVYPPEDPRIVYCESCYLKEIV